MERTSASSSWDRAQALYDKNIELENKRRKSTQARIPSDPNAWQQMRENYESIIFEDHGFSEQHNIETALWLLHYRRIEEMRSRFQSALNSSGSSISDGSKSSGRSDIITKIRLQFKTFLSEATGFYHELILKIKSKYGLPLGYFSEVSDIRSGSENDGKRSNEIMKGLVSCHRCLIYLGDLARYKGLYGEEDSKSREYAAASSYYLQAASLGPSIGNSHHQLAILASYTGDDLVAVYRYYRSLAVKNPFTTARDNLIVAFEKNRQSFAQLLGDSQTAVVRDRKPRVSGKGRGKTDTKNGYRSVTPKMQDLLKAFSIRFVRLNGILFTRTSIETIEEVLTMTRSALIELLSSGSDEKLQFGSDSTENSLYFVRLTSMLIFTVYNVKKESECQTYAEIVQRTVLLQNASTAAFELMGCIVERVVQLSDPLSSYLMPGILVFLEWLACSPDISTSEVDTNLSVAKDNFWNICIKFLNKILSMSATLLDEHDEESCFYSMRSYEGETGNCCALAEDFELRGFLPVFPAHSILDFSRMLSPATDAAKEKTSRINRVLAAGKALVNVVQIDKKSVWFDSRTKMFMVGAGHQISEESVFDESNFEMKNEENLDNFDLGSNALSVHGDSPHGFTELDEEDEVIVFKPLVSGKSNVSRTPVSALPDYSNFYENSSVGNLLATTTLANESGPIHPVSASISPIGNNKYQQHQPLHPRVPNMFPNEVADLSNSMKAVRVNDNGDFFEMNVPREAVRFNESGNFMELNVPSKSVRLNDNGRNFMDLNKPSESVRLNDNGRNFMDLNVPNDSVRLNDNGRNFMELNVPNESVRFRDNGRNFMEVNVSNDAVRFNASGNFMERNVSKDAVVQFPSANSLSLFYSQTKMAETGKMVPLPDDLSSLNDPKNRKTMSNRPARHIGPPPGFSRVPSKQSSEHVSDVSPGDNYTWLDDYQIPPLTRSPAVNYLENNFSLDGTRTLVGDNGSMGFPFPGKQGGHVHQDNKKVYQPTDMSRALQDQHLQYQFLHGNQQILPKPDQYNGQSFWSDRFIV